MGSSPSKESAPTSNDSAMQELIAAELRKALLDPTLRTPTQPVDVGWQQAAMLRSVTRRTSDPDVLGDGINDRSPGYHAYEPEAAGRQGINPQIESGDLRRLREKLHKLKDEQEAREKELDGLKVELGKLQEVKRNYEGLQNKLVEEEFDQQRLKKQIQDLTAEVEKKQREISDLKSQVQDLAAEVKDKKREIAQLERDKQRFESEAESERRKRLEQHTELEKKVQKYNSLMMEKERIEKQYYEARKQLEFPSSGSPGGFSFGATQPREVEKLQRNLREAQDELAQKERDLMRKHKKEIEDLTEQQEDLVQQHKKALAKQKGEKEELIEEHKKALAKQKKREDELKEEHERALAEQKQKERLLIAKQEDSVSEIQVLSSNRASLEQRIKMMTDGEGSPLKARGGVQGGTPKAALSGSSPVSLENVGVEAAAFKNFDLSKFESLLTTIRSTQGHDVDVAAYLLTQEEEIKRLQEELEREKKDFAELTGNLDYGRADGELKDHYIEQTTKALGELHQEGRQGLVNVKSLTALLQVTHGDILKSLRKMLLEVSDTLKAAEQQKKKEDAIKNHKPYIEPKKLYEPGWLDNDPLTWNAATIEQADMERCKQIMAEVERKFAYDLKRRMMDADKQAQFQKLYTSIPNKSPLYTASLAGNATNMMPHLKNFLFPIDKQEVTSSEGKMFELALSVDAFDAPTSGRYQNDRLALQKFREFLTAKFGELRNATKYITLWSSPVKAVTVHVQAREAAQIPTGAAFYSYCYPYEFVRDGPNGRTGRDILLEDLEAAHISTNDPFVTWILSGGFIYYDYVYEILAINAIATESAVQDGSVTSCLYLGVPTRMMGNCVQTLKDKGRWKKVTHTALVQQGFLQFVWVTPSEMINNTIFTKSGGFAYQFRKVTGTSGNDDEKEFQYWFFPVVPYTLLDQEKPTEWESPVHIPEYINFYKALQMGGSNVAAEAMDFTESKYVPDVSTMQAGEGHLSALGLSYVARMCKKLPELYFLEKSDGESDIIWKKCLGSSPEAGKGGHKEKQQKSGGVKVQDEEGNIEEARPESDINQDWDKPQAKVVQKDLRALIEELQALVSHEDVKLWSAEGSAVGADRDQTEEDGVIKIVREFVAVSMRAAWDRKFAAKKEHRIPDETDMVMTFNDGTWRDQEDWKNLIYILKETKPSLDKIRGNDGLEIERDKGRTDISFLYFVQHAEAANAHLLPSEVLALRLYTTSSFKLINVHLREASQYASNTVRHEQKKLKAMAEVLKASKNLAKSEEPNGREEVKPKPGVPALQKGKSVKDIINSLPTSLGLPRPQTLQDDKRPTLYLPNTTALISSALKKLRVQNLNNEDFLPTELWRGMKNVSSSELFARKGGAEGACMSTTPNLRVVANYSKSNSPLLLKIKIDSPMDHGADISWLSVFPGEQEVLYPPLTFLKPIRVQPIREMEGKGQVITVKPSFPS